APRRRHGNIMKRPGSPLRGSPLRGSPLRGSSCIFVDLRVSSWPLRGSSCTFVDLRVSVFLACAWWLAVASPLAAQPLQPIRYTLSFPAPHTHYLEVEASIPTDGQRVIDLMMPVWTPGSYLVREYSRNVESLTVSDATGAARPIEKTRKN